MNTNKTTVNGIREDALGRIKDCLKRNNISKLRLAEVSDIADCPIVLENSDDCERTFTLDSIELSGANLLFGASSAWDDITLRDREIGVEVLIDINDWLDEYAEDIEEWAEENRDENEPGKKRPYVIRFYWRQWVDITVEAESQEEAYILATNRYDDGDYEESPENYENTDCTDVTDTYNADKIPYPNRNRK